MLRQLRQLTVKESIVFVYVFRTSTDTPELKQKKILATLCTTQNKKNLMISIVYVQYGSSFLLKTLLNVELSFEVLFT